MPVESPDQSFQLLDVHIEHLLISGSEAFKDDPSNPEQIRVDHELQWAFRFEEEELALRLMVYVDGLDDHGEALGAKLEIGIVSYLSVEFLKDYVIQEEAEEGKPEYRVDPILGRQLLNHVYPMIRGIVLERTRGALLGPVLLPYQDLEHLITQ